MAVARAVTSWDRSTFAWVGIEDEDGVSHHYDKAKHSPDEHVVHVSYGFDTTGAVQTLGLVRGSDGKPILRQDEPGLPPKIVVEYNDKGWEAKYEYEHQQADDSERQE
jgi:hypothetical protein